MRGEGLLPEQVAERLGKGKGARNRPIEGP